jgi:hypothetical protein
VGRVIYPKLCVTDLKQEDLKLEKALLDVASIFQTELYFNSSRRAEGGGLHMYMHTYMNMYINM